MNDRNRKRPATSSESTPSTEISSASSRTSVRRATTTTMTHFGGAGVALYLWWGLAAVAAAIAFGLVATECFDSDNTQTNTASSRNVDSETDDAAPAEQQIPLSPGVVQGLATTALTDAQLPDVGVQVDGSTVVLFGLVDTEADRATAEQALSGVEGVEKVTNKLMVKPKTKPKNVTDSGPKATDSNSEPAGPLKKENTTNMNSDSNQTDQTETNSDSNQTDPIETNSDSNQTDQTETNSDSNQTDPIEIEPSFAG